MLKSFDELFPVAEDLTQKVVATHLLVPGIQVQGAPVSEVGQETLTLTESAVDGPRPTLAVGLQVSLIANRLLQGVKESVRLQTTAH